MEKIESSVVIPTYNGADKISAILNALEQQTFKDFETIIVVDGSTDNTQKIIQDTEWQLRNLRIILQENQGRAKVRNRGAEEAQGEILIFFDDDIIPEIDSVEKHIKFHGQIAKAILGGNVLEDNKKMTADIQFYRASLSRKWTKHFEDGLNLLDEDNIFLSAANFSIRKSLFVSLGGFRKELHDAEDLDFALSAVNKGYKVYFDKGNIGWHNDFITCRSYIKRLREYQQAHAYLRDRYHQNHILMAPVNDNIFKRIIYRALSSRIWVDMVDKSNLLLLLPKRIRYKLYDIIITSLSTKYPFVDLGESK